MLEHAAPSPDPGRIVVAVGPSRLTITPAALAVVTSGDRHELRVLRTHQQGRRGSDLWRHVSPALAARLAELGVSTSTRRPPRKGIGGWQRGNFEIRVTNGDETTRTVHGWRRGGWGIPLYYVDATGAAIVDNWSRPEQALTHLLSGRAGGGVVGVAKARRLADLLTERCPDLERTEEADLTPEQREIARAAAEEIA